MTTTGKIWAVAVPGDHNNSNNKTGPKYMNISTTHVIIINAIIRSFSAAVFQHHQH